MSGLPGRSAGVVNPDPQARGSLLCLPSAPCIPSGDTRFVSPGDPQQRNLLLLERLSRASKSRLTTVVLACPADPGQPRAGPGGGRDHEQHRAGEQARSVPHVSPGRPRPAPGLSLCPSRLSHAHLLAAFLPERASFLGGSYLRVAPWSWQQEEGPPRACSAPASPPSHPTSPLPPALGAWRGSWVRNRCFHVSGWDTQASGRQAAVTRAAVLTPLCDCPQPYSGEPRPSTTRRGGPATRRAHLLVQSGSVPLKLGGRREHSPRNAPRCTGSRGQGRATDVGAASVCGWAAGHVPGRSPLLFFSLRAAVAVPPGPRDLLHGQLPAAHEGTVSQRRGPWALGGKSPCAACKLRGQGHAWAPRASVSTKWNVRRVQR